MKVQTGEDAKASPIEVKAPAERSRSVTVDYQLDPAVPRQSAYINVSKLVLLILAIIATFLACIIFARDLWGAKNLEKHHGIHHQKRIAAAPPTDNLDRLPFPEDFLNDFPGFPVNNIMKDEKDDKDGVMSKVTKITFRVFPNDKDEDPEKTKVQAPVISDNMMDDVFKMMMNIMGAVGPSDRQDNHHSVDHHSPLFDLPTLGGQMPARHPKLIIVRRIHSNPSSNMDNDMLKNILDGISGGANVHKPVSLTPIVPQKVDPIESFFHELNKDFPFVKRVMLRPSKPKSVEMKESTDAPSAWSAYKSIIFKLARNVDTVLDETDSLKNLVGNEIKNTESATDDEINKEKATQIKAFYNDVKDTLNKMRIPLTDASVFIKTEAGAMDLIKTNDRKTLIKTIDSFTKAILGPLDEVFGASTNLTKTSGNENIIPDNIYKSIVKLGNKLIHFGKIVYEDVAGLRKNLENVNKKNVKPVSHEVVDSSENIDAKHDSEYGMATPETPKVVRRIVLFKPSLSDLFPLPMAGLKDDTPFIRRQ